MLRRVLPAGATAVAALVLTLLVPSAAAPSVHPAAPAGSPDYADYADPADYAFSFLSSPDLLNSDVADVRSSPFYRRGAPNSINADYRASLDVVYDQFATEEVRDLLVAGDLVEGHWGRDDARTGTFGPVRTYAQRVRAVTRAARLYYGESLARVTSRGMRLVPAIGDHEIGDNNWRAGTTAYNRFKRRSFPVWKKNFRQALLTRSGGGRRFADHPTGPARHTAYATFLHPEVLLVTVDVFRRVPGDVVPQLDQAQLRWLKRVLRGARTGGVDWVVVQGHVPVLKPVRTTGSSGIFYRGGSQSPFWRALTKYDVDLYLSGEVHNVTAVSRSSGPLQISHGGLFAFGGTNYLRADVTSDRLDVVVRKFQRDTAIVDPDQPRLWQTHRTIPGSIRYLPNPPVVGTLSLLADGRVQDRTGLLTPFHR